jgi:hypothetical protein
MYGLVLVSARFTEIVGQGNEESPGNDTPRNSLLGPQRGIVEPSDESLVVDDIMSMFYCN